MTCGAKHVGKETCPCLLAGSIEFLLIIHVVKAGMIMANKLHMWIHFLIETPVLVSSILALVFSDEPLSSSAQLSHLLSIVFTMAIFFGTFTWLYLLQPVLRHWTSTRKVETLPIARNGLGLSGAQGVAKACRPATIQS